MKKIYKFLRSITLIPFIGLTLSCNQKDSIGHIQNSTFNIPIYKVEVNNSSIRILEPIKANNFYLDLKP
jgi:hypothetical protein